MRVFRDFYDGLLSEVFRGIYYTKSDRLYVHKFSPIVSSRTCFKPLLFISRFLSLLSTPGLSHENHFSGAGQTTLSFHRLDLPVRFGLLEAIVRYTHHCPSWPVEWSSKYPKTNAIPEGSSVPKEWLNSLQVAMRSGKIPDLPISAMGSAGSPVYPNGLDPSSPDVCSSTYQCRIPGTIWDGPNGTFGISFDDGPLPVSTGSHSVWFRS